MLRVGYSYWGFLGDVKIEDGKEVSTPDGNATYSWALLWEMRQRGWQVWSMQKDRDVEGWADHGDKLFSAFSQEKRTKAYIWTSRTYGEVLPELDVLLLEWRFPIPGRNCNIDDDGNIVFFESCQPDLRRQTELLKHYKEKGTKVIIWDLDHKLDIPEELIWQPDAIFETSAQPRNLTMERTRVEPPIIVEDLLQFPTVDSTIMKKMAYIGSRYERDDIIDKWIKPTSEKYPYDVHFYGNWLKTLTECQELWPKVKYHDRVTTRDFHKIYMDAVCCPLLAKQSYLETGFITPRPWEALMFGTIPVGLLDHLGIEQYVEPGLIAGDGQDMIEVVETLTGLNVAERDLIRKENVAMLEFMDARHFVDRIEDVASKTTT